MELIKRIILKIFSCFGYRIIAADSSLVSLENFKSLAEAYEQLHNKVTKDCPIRQDERRYVLLARLLGTQPLEAYCIIEALEKTRNVNGDICEFGVAQGETSAFIANEIREYDKRLHLFDSFQGLPRPTEKDALKDDIFSLGNIDAYAGTMACAESMVRARLKAISFPENRYVIHKGFIEEVLRKDENLPKRVSFAYVDLDLYEPTAMTLNYLHGVISAHSIIIVDDYDFFSTGIKTAVDEFIARRNAHEKIYDIIVPYCQYSHFAILSRTA